MMISVMWYTLSPDEGMQPLSHNVTCNPENILGCKLRVQLLERNGWTQTTLCFIMVCCMSLSSEQKLLSKCREFIFTFGTLKVLCVKVGGLSQGFLLTHSKHKVAACQHSCVDPILGLYNPNNKFNLYSQTNRGRAGSRYLCYLLIFIGGVSLKFTL